MSTHLPVLQEVCTQPKAIFRFDFSFDLKISGYSILVNPVVVASDSNVIHSGYFSNVVDMICENSADASFTAKLRRTYV